MSDKLNCFECKNWFDVNELIYLPTERYYLCHHDAATYYAMKCETLRAERDELKQRAEAAESNVRFYDGFMIGADMPDVKQLLAVVEAARYVVGETHGVNDGSVPDTFKAHLTVGDIRYLAAVLARVDGEK